MHTFETPGKWILAGEHSVLRGGTALVFPVSGRCLKFSHSPGETPLELNIPAKHSDLEMAFWGVLEKALQNLNLTRCELNGKLDLESNIPVGAGMGASATLCVSLAHWFEALGFLESSQKYEFAKNLEDLFHGESSGVDVAVALNKKGLTFKRPGEMMEFNPQWKPHFYLSYCGKRGVTADCVEKVQKLYLKDAELGKVIDQDMQEAVEGAMKSMGGHQELDSLVDSIKLAHSCFERWGLVSRDLEAHGRSLEQSGALAVKPTGSGDGGFVLSLWRTEPTLDLIQDFDLIKA